MTDLYELVWLAIVDNGAFRRKRVFHSRTKADKWVEIQRRDMKSAVYSLEQVVLSAD